jgi:predicted RNA-binding Zn ribbon-like protein
MTGEMHLAGENIANPQPGDREPAPGDLALVQAFINSNYDLELDHGAELLHSPAGLRDWLARRGLTERGARATSADLARALALREGLRALLVAKRGERDGVAIDDLNDAAGHLAATVVLEPEGPRFVARDQSVAGGMGLIVSYAAVAMLDGTWSRLKACRECRWAFYDRSRNSTGNWCSMAVCGGRVKQRAHYARRTRR